MPFRSASAARSNNGDEKRGYAHDKRNVREYGARVIALACELRVHDDHTHVRLSAAGLVARLSPRLARLVSTLRVPYRDG